MRAVMFHTRTEAEVDDDPAVRATVARLRASVVAAAGGSLAFLVLGIVAIRRAWVEGVERGQSGGDVGVLPPLEGLLIVGLGFAALGTLLVLVVRGPFDRARLQALELVDTNRRLQETTLETFAALGAAVEARDRYTAGHGLRVTLVSILIGQELGLDARDLDTLRHAATFHDIGKLAVPDQVLQRRGRLTDADYEAMKVHPVEGARICSKLHSLREAIPLVRSHHERVDGRGYPDGLHGDEIPLGARIIAVADAWDAITSDRPYRDGQPAFVALEEIRRCAGTQFDAIVVRAFVEVLARDPWMFGLTPEDVAERRPVHKPAAASRGVDHERGMAELRDGYLADERDGDDARSGERGIDWSHGFDADDLRAS